MHSRSKATLNKDATTSTKTKQTHVQCRTLHQTTNQFSKTWTKIRNYIKQTQCIADPDYIKQKWHYINKDATTQKEWQTKIWLQSWASAASHASSEFGGACVHRDLCCVGFVFVVFVLCFCLCCLSCFVSRWLEQRELVCLSCRLV